uniref:Reverse transcriptase zinc-binding domain-containing protein n=1 Tax=Aegilops tauschii subsp. strangulata TaxID=200361 RepID=A0A453IFM1_AEGTS
WSSGMDGPPCSGRIGGSTASPSVNSCPTNGNSWARDIHGNLGLHEIDQYLQLWQVLQHTVLSAAPDQLIWKWTASSTYSAQSCYLATFHGSTTCCTWKLEAYLEVLGTGWPTKTGAGPLRDWLDMYCNITPAASYAIKSRKRSSTCCWNAPSLARHGTRPWPGCAFQPQSPTASPRSWTGGSMPGRTRRRASRSP